MSLAVRRTFLTSAACALAAALTATPALAAKRVATPGCPDTAVTQPFAPWQDSADYFLAPDGDIEAGATSWGLHGGAHAVEGNAPFQVGAATDHTSLALPAGSTAITPRMCINATHRTMRFFATGAAGSRLVVHAQVFGRGRALGRVRLGAVTGSGAWDVSGALPMRVNKMAPGFGNALSVSLHFTPRGAHDWQIDDVYIDPFRTK